MRHRQRPQQAWAEKSFLGSSELESLLNKREINQKRLTDKINPDPAGVLRPIFFERVVW